MILITLFSTHTAQICEAVKNGACALGAEKPETQVMLLTTIRDVASSVADLINVTKNAVGKTIQDPSVNDLSTSAYVSWKFKSI